MFRKNYLIFVLMMAALLVSNNAVFAQSASTVMGRIVTKDEKGKEIAVPNILVEIYLTDSEEKPASYTTDEKGEFEFKNLTEGKVYALVVSGVGISPSVTPDLSTGKKFTITVIKGEGSRPLEEEVREALAAAAAAAKGEPTTAQKKLLAEREAERAKTENFNVTVKRLLEEGNKALNDKNYDLAITKYEEGYQANNNFLGSAPTFLNNKGSALRARAVEYHNKSANSGDDKTAKTSFNTKSSQDFSNGIDAYYASWTLLKNATEADKTSTSNYKDSKALALNGAQNLLSYAVRTEKADPAKMDKVKELLGEYINSEADKNKKIEGQVILADYYRLAGDFDTGISEYRKILSTSPNDAGALFGLGLSLVSTGYNDDGSIKKPQLQEAANLLKRFTEVAPAASQREIRDATDTLTALKDGNSITPKKN